LHVRLKVAHIVKFNGEATGEFKEKLGVKLAPVQLFFDHKKKERSKEDQIR